MGHNNHFYKEKHIYLNSSDKAIIGLLATLVCPTRKYTSEQQKEDAMVTVHELKAVLTGKARRVADCVIDPNADDKFKIKDAAKKISEWAEKVGHTDNLLSEEIEVSEDVEESAISVN